jgi:hypothetical protein
VLTIGFSKDAKGSSSTAVTPSLTIPDHAAELGNAMTVNEVAVIITISRRLRLARL